MSEIHYKHFHKQDNGQGSYTWMYLITVLNDDVSERDPGDKREKANFIVRNHRCLLGLKEYELRVKSGDMEIMNE